MGRLSSTRTRRLLRVLAIAVVAISSVATWAIAAGPGGWDHLGDGGSPRVRLAERRRLRAGGDDGWAVRRRSVHRRGRHRQCGRIAKWAGGRWSAVSSPASPITAATWPRSPRGRQGLRRRRLHERGERGRQQSRGLGRHRWGTACIDSVRAGNQRERHQVADRRTDHVRRRRVPRRCAHRVRRLPAGLRPPDPRAELHDRRRGRPFRGTVYALTADSKGRLYAGGGFSNLEGISGRRQRRLPDCRRVAAWDRWRAMRRRGRQLRTRSHRRRDERVRRYGADQRRRHPQADHVVKWNGSAWSAMGSNNAGTDGWFPSSDHQSRPGRRRLDRLRHGVVPERERRSAADHIAFFDGSAWHPVGSNGAGNGPLVGEGVRAGDRRPAALCGRRASPAPAATTRRSPSPRSRSRRSSPTRRRR